MLDADDQEDVAQEAFARPYRRQDALRNPGGLAYLRATTCSPTRNRIRHLRVPSRADNRLACLDHDRGGRVRL